MHEPDETKLDAVQERIDDTRAKAKEHGTLPPEHRQTFADPDADGEIEDYKVQTGG